MAHKETTRQSIVEKDMISVYRVTNREGYPNFVAKTMNAHVEFTASGRKYATNHDYKSALGMITGCDEGEEIDLGARLQDITIEVYRELGIDLSSREEILEERSEITMQKITAARMIIGFYNQVAAHNLLTKCDQKNIVAKPEYLHIFEDRDNPASFMVETATSDVGECSVRGYLHSSGVSDQRDQYLQGGYLMEYAQNIQSLGNALALLHSNGIYFRDLKPDNMVRMSDGTWRMIDFDTTLALPNDYQKLEDEIRKRSTLEFHMPTFAYAYPPRLLYNSKNFTSPDQLQAEESYSLAMFICCMITGQNGTETAARVRAGYPPNTYNQSQSTIFEDMMLFAKCPNIKQDLLQFELEDFEFARLPLSDGPPQEILDAKDNLISKLVDATKTDGLTNLPSVPPQEIAIAAANYFEAIHVASVAS